MNDEKNEKEKENNTINNDESFWFWNEFQKLNGIT